ncbi:MAG: hypothetical protein Q4F82_09095 [bacterium]|nr:hypothetical protein [bacterium]
MQKYRGRYHSSSYVPKNPYLCSANKDIKSAFRDDMGNVDVCVGFNDDWSRPDKALLDYAVNLFEDNGYSVGINYPYSNSEAPQCAFGYQSMMLEVNKRVYLEGRSPYLKTHYDKKRSVREVLGLLMESVAG